MNEDFDLDIGLGDASDDFFGDANAQNDNMFGNDLDQDFGMQDMSGMPGTQDMSGIQDDSQYQIPDGYNPQNSFEMQYNEEDDEGASKRKAIIIGAIGICIILLTVSIAGFALKSKKGGGSKSKSEQIVKEQVQMPQNTGSVNSSGGRSGWTEIDPDKNIRFSDPISADFTPTNVRHYIKTTTTGEIEVKSIVTGSISGLTGTYELEITYSQGCLLERGQYFSITYRIGEMNGQQIISDIVY